MRWNKNLWACIDANRWEIFKFSLLSLRFRIQCRFCPCRIARVWGTMTFATRHLASVSPQWEWSQDSQHYVQFNTFPVGVGFCQSCPLCDSHGQHLNYSSAFCRWCVSTGVIIWPLVCTESNKCEADGMGVKWWIAPSVLGMSYCPKQMSTSILYSALITSVHFYIL